MERCVFANREPLVKIAYAVNWFVPIMMMGMSIYIMSFGFYFVFIGALFAVLSIVWFAYYGRTMIVDGRRYCVDDTGITVCYCGIFKKTYTWDQFKKIVICDYAHAQKMPTNCLLIIRLSTIDEPCGPLSEERHFSRPGIDYWREYNYTVSKFSKIIFVEFTRERLEEIREKSHLDVVYSLTILGEAAHKSILE